jgi:hypothetical protein
MASWMWLNLVLGAVFVLAIVGVPLWIVLRHPDVRQRLEHKLEYELGHELAQVRRSAHLPSPRSAPDRLIRPVQVRSRLRAGVRPSRVA